MVPYSRYIIPSPLTHHQCAQVLFVNETAETPSSDQCSNSTQVTTEFNETATFGVPSVAFNETSVQGSESGSTSAAPSGSAAASGTTPASASNRLVQEMSILTVVAGVIFILFVCS